VIEVTADIFQSLATKDHAQGIGIVARQRTFGPRLGSAG
jgi:hypothetical protein